MRLAALVLAGAMVAQGAAAQAVRARVVALNAEAVPGAIVTLVDSTDTPIARALSDDQGEVSMRLPAAGQYRFQVMRLGFRPTLVTPFRVAAGQVVERPIALTDVAIPLSPVHIVAERGCLTDVDSSSAAFFVWEEARKALIAAQLTRMTRAYSMDVGLFSSRQGSDAKEAPIISRDERHIENLRPFVTLPPERLAAEGYVLRGTKSDRYFAPDEDVLLSESFAATHCLRLLPDSGSADLIRLGFTPLPERRQADIKGVLLVDRSTSELRRIDFSYVNLRASEMLGSPNGELAFRRLPEGSWIIEYWALGIPFFEEHVQKELINNVPVRPVRVPPPKPTVTSVRTGRVITGGGVTRVRFGDSVIWQAVETPKPHPRVPLPPNL